MNSSDSEEFESADEGFDSKPKKSPRKLIISKTPDYTPKSVVERPSSSNNNVNDNEPSPNITATITTTEKTATTTSALPDKLLISTCTESTVDDGDNDGWNVDNWDDGDLEDTIQDLRSNITSNTNALVFSSCDMCPVLERLDTLKRQCDSIDQQQLFNVTASPPTTRDITNSQYSRSFTNALDRMAGEFDKKNKPAPYSGWFNSILSSATEGVATITSHVSLGLSSVIGVPEPEQLARMQKEEMIAAANNQQKSSQEQSEEPSNKNAKQIDLSTVDDNKEFGDVKGPSEDSAISLGRTLVGGVTKIGNQVIMGGLDTLEGIGKKTMTILQENDPGLLKMRRSNTDAGAGGNDLNNTFSNESFKSLNSQRGRARQMLFETLFDDYYGMVHFEALKILSKQSKLKLESLLAPLSGAALDDAEQTLIEVEELCEIPVMAESESNQGYQTVDELTRRLQCAFDDIGVECDWSDFVKIWDTNLVWLSEEDHTAEDVYEKGMRCLSETIAMLACKLHKCAELILIKDYHSTASEAESLGSICECFRSHLSGIAARFAEQLKKIADDTGIEDEHITHVFLAENCSTEYIDRIHELFIPILQIGAI